jgi:protein-tyrosine phosphatase
LKRLRWQLDFRLGRFNRLTRIDWTRVRRVVFVCKGNICRSPYAEALARQRGVWTISGGLEAAGGKPADDTAILVAHGRGVDLRPHVSQNTSCMQLDTSDLIVVMEPAHLDGAAALAARANAQHTLAGLWCEPQRASIDDPFGRNAAQFAACFTLLDEAIEKLVTRIHENAKNPVSDQRHCG